MRAILAAAVLLLSSAPAFAVPITLRFTGTVYLVSSTVAAGLAAIGVGDEITGTYTYDADLTADTNASDIVGQYPFSSANSGATFQLTSAANGQVLLDGSGWLEQIAVNDDWSYPGYPTIDAFTARGTFSVGSEVFTFWVYLQNRDTNLDVITSDALLAPPPSFDQFNYTRGTLSSSLSLGQVYFDVTSATLVPEPGSLALLASGLVLLPAIPSIKAKLGARRS